MNKQQLMDRIKSDLKHYPFDSVYFNREGYLMLNLGNGYTVKLNVTINHSLSDLKCEVVNWIHNAYYDDPRYLEYPTPDQWYKYK